MSAMFEPVFRRPIKDVFPFFIDRLFAGGEPGVWYDPSDLATLFQDRAGTIPVTATGQSVGYVLDKSGRGNHLTANSDAARGLYQVDGTGRPYILFDGSDDGYVTPTIIPGADKVQVFAGVRKLSDAAVALVAEFSVSLSNGSFYLAAPNSVGPSYGFASRGTASSVLTGTSFAAPLTNVLTGLGDISGDRATLRVNGTQVAQSATDQGAGNYLSHSLYVGRRGAVSLPFNGRIYSLIVRFGPNLSSQRIRQVERYVGEKTGVNL